jgi:acetylornithine deacetylase
MFSVNPMGRRSGPEYFGRMTSASSSENSVGEIEVVRAGRMLRAVRTARRSSEIDGAADATRTPSDGMTIDPFLPTVREDRLYGRGACDVKGGMAAMLAAFARLVRERPPRAAHVLMSCTCDEESTILGVSDLVKLWSGPARRSPLCPAPPHAAIVAEPTDLDVVVAHRVRPVGRSAQLAAPVTAPALPTA